MSSAGSRLRSSTSDWRRTASCTSMRSSSPESKRPAAAALGRLDARQHDLIDVQEAVLLEADVDERRLQARQHIVDLALIDVADDRAVALALQVQLGDPVIPGRLAPPARCA